jgi:hypothetical protein
MLGRRGKPLKQRVIRLRIDLRDHKLSRASVPRSILSKYVQKQRIHECSGSWGGFSSDDARMQLRPLRC